MTGPGPVAFGGGPSELFTISPVTAALSSVADADGSQLMLTTTTINIAYRAALQTTSAIRHVSLQEFLR